MRLGNIFGFVRRGQSTVVLYFIVADGLSVGCYGLNIFEKFVTSRFFEDMFFVLRWLRSSFLEKMPDLSVLLDYELN